MLPEGYDRRSQISPLFSYPYRAARDSLQQLRRLGDPDACHAYKLHYINPVTGGSAMPTVSTSMQLFPKGSETQTNRSTTGTVFAAVEGSVPGPIAGDRS